MPTCSLWKRPGSVTETATCYSKSTWDIWPVMKHLQLGWPGAWRSAASSSIGSFPTSSSKFGAFAKSTDRTASKPSTLELKRCPRRLRMVVLIPSWLRWRGVYSRQLTVGRRLFGWTSVCSQNRPARNLNGPDRTRTFAFLARWVPVTQRSVQLYRKDVVLSTLSCTTKPSTKRASKSIWRFSRPRKA